MNRRSTCRASAVSAGRAYPDHLRSLGRLDVYGALPDSPCSQLRAGPDQPLCLKVHRACAQGHYFTLERAGQAVMIQLRRPRRGRSAPSKPQSPPWTPPILYSCPSTHPLLRRTAGVLLLSASPLNSLLERLQPFDEIHPSSIRSSASMAHLYRQATPSRLEHVSNAVLAGHRSSSPAAGAGALPAGSVECHFRALPVEPPLALCHQPPGDYEQAACARHHRRHPEFLRSPVRRPRHRRNPHDSNLECSYSSVSPSRGSPWPSVPCVTGPSATAHIDPARLTDPSLAGVALSIF